MRFRLLLFCLCLPIALFALPEHDASGRWVVSSITSHPDPGGEVTTMCSLVARRNLETLFSVTRQKGRDIIAGNATQLIREGVQANTLLSYRTPESLISAIKKTEGVTIYDLYEWRPKTAKIGVGGVKYRLPSQQIEAGHRVVAFL
jgi:hypothetical protein